MKKLILSALIILFAFVVQAQHEHHMQDTKKKTSDSMQMNGMMMNHQHDTLPGKNMPMNGMEMDHNQMGQMNMDEISMNHAFSLNLPMSRNGSGTGWLPDASPMYGVMYHFKNWMYMLHGNLFLRYDNQDFSHKGSRGDDQLDAPNWLMFMGQRKVGKNGLFHFSSMLSLDPLTVGNAGYPLLFQSGESYKGKSLVDRQHPHDLFLNYL
ncbi:MAG: hypothetical protein ACTHOB_09470 [Ginsengibacter sp.]